MLSDDGVEVTVEDVPATDSSSCTALVPVVQTAQWSARQEPPRPNSVFVTQLIAAEVQSPPTSGPEQATALNAFSAYRTSKHRVEDAGMRANEIT